MLVVLVLIYPGHWVGDEFYILNEVKQYSLNSWQNYITNIYYTFCLYIIPTGVGIVIFQIVFASLVVGYITSTARKLFNNEKITYLLIIPFLFFPVILNNFYPLRLTMYSYFEVLLISKIIFLVIGNIRNKNRYIDLFGYTFLVTILCFWRTEGIYYLITLPIIVILLKIFKNGRYKRINTYIYILPSVFIVVLGFLTTSLTSNPRYQLTSTINPLSTMLQHKLKGDKISESLAIINESVDVNILKKYPSYNEIPSFWQGAVRNNFNPSNLSSYNRAFLYIVKNNPEYFAENRMNLFLSTNSLGSKLPLTTSQFYNTESVAKDSVNNFYINNYISKPINLDIKLYITRLLLLINNNDKALILSRLVWSIIPTLIILFCLMLYKLIRKQYFWVLIITLISTRVLLIFLTAPANYFMYYLPVYMSGNLVIYLLLLKLLDKNRSQ